MTKHDYQIERVHERHLIVIVLAMALIDVAVFAITIKNASFAEPSFWSWMLAFIVVTYILCFEGSQYTKARTKVWEYRIDQKRYRYFQQADQSRKDEARIRFRLYQQAVDKTGCFDQHITDKQVKKAYAHELCEQAIRGLNQEAHDEN